MWPSRTSLSVGAEAFFLCESIGVVRANGGHLFGFASVEVDVSGDLHDLRSDRGGASGDDYIVGYASVLIYKNGNNNDSEVQESVSIPGKLSYKPVNSEVQDEFLKLGRQAIAEYLDKGVLPEYEPKFDVMNEKRGVFVTLTKYGMLRGCIGHHESDIPLYQLVPEMAVAAAFNDPRFPRLQKEELKDIKIKVSIYLTNVYKIDSIENFEMGRHGIIMIKDGRGATYLPDVPIEAGWRTKEEELRSLCQKAGLPLDAWKEGAEFYLYETQVFEESK